MSGRYCVIIPAFEAQQSIQAIVSRVKAQGFPVIVVDDGSKDQTAAVAAGAGALVISHLRNQGKGRALRTGFEHAVRERYDGVITMDSDEQHDPVDITQLIRVGEYQHAALVLGNRMANGSSMPRARVWANTFMSRLISLLIRQHIPDSQCGFRVIRREVLESVPLCSNRFEIETELLLGAAKRRWKIISVPVRTIYLDHASHIRPIWDGLRFTGTVLRHLVRR